MSANIHPPYNPQILPVRAKQLAKECRAIAENNPQPDVVREQMHFLGAVNWVTNLSDAIIVQVIAESIPDTGLTVDEIYRVESWDELTMLVFNEYLDDPVRDLFRAVDISSQVYEFVVPEDNVFAAPTMMSEDDEFPMNEQTFTTHTLGYNTYSAKTQLGGVGGHRTLNDLAGRFSQDAIGDLVELLPDAEHTDGTVEFDEHILDAMDSITCDGYYPDKVIARDKRDIGGSFNTSVETIFGMEIECSDYVRPGTAIIADSDHVGYEGIWDSGEARSHDPWNRNLDPEIPFQPIQVDYQQRTNGIVLNEDAVKHIKV